MRRIVAINAGWLVSDRVFRLAINLGVGILIARHLGPDQFGLLSLGQMLLTLLLPLATFGLSEILVREFSNGERSPRMVLATALRLRILLALVSLAVMMLVAYVLRGSDRVALMVVLAYGLSFIPQALDTIESRFQSLNRVGAISTVRIIGTILFGGIRVMAVVFGLAVETFAMLYTLEVAIVGMLAVAQARRYGVEANWGGWDRQEARFLLKESTPLMLRLMTISIYMRVDQLVISIFMGDRALGIYSVATRISELWYFIPTSIMLAAMPSLTQKYKISMLEYESNLSAIMRVMVILSVPSAIFISLFSETIIVILFGEAYRAAAPALSIQAWAGVFVAIGIGANPWFINTGQMRYGLYQAMAGAAVGIGLNMILVPRLGLVGASISMVASYAVSAILLNAVFARTRGLFKMQMKALVLQ